MREPSSLRSPSIQRLRRDAPLCPPPSHAAARTESFGPRDRIALSCSLNLEYGASASQIRGALRGIEALLSAHPKISTADPPQVRLADLGASALKVEVYATFQITDGSQFTLVRQEVLLSMMEAVEKAGARLALPAQTIHLAGGFKPEP